MSRDDRRLMRPKRSLDDLKIRAADAAGTNRDEDLARLQLSYVALFDAKRVIADWARCIQYRGSHLLSVCGN